jgi:hypothetical protein
MLRDNLPNEPWEALDKLLQRTPANLAFQRHPSRRVLSSYLQQSLSQRPNQWSEERAEKLNRGELTDWTMWEVAAHLANCSRCRSRIKALENAQGRQTTMNWLRTLKDTLRKPRLAPVGWALAGVQTALLIALLTWINIGPSIQPITTLPIYIDANNSSFNNVVLPADLVRIELIGEVRIEEITSLMQTLQLRLVGPDSEGQYLLKKSAGSYLTQEDEEIMEQLRTYPLLLNISEKSGLHYEQSD